MCSLFYNKIMKICVLLFLLVAFFSCKKEKTNTKNTVVASVEEDTILRNIPRIQLYTLKKEVKEKLEGVSTFELIQDRIDSVNIGSYVGDKNNVSELCQDVLHLYKTIPLSFKNKQVLSRLNQLRTYSLLLKNGFDNKYKDSLKLEITIVRTLEAYNSLIVQLNETENSISEDFKKELEKSKFERDSLKQKEVAPLF